MSSIYGPNHHDSDNDNSGDDIDGDNSQSRGSDDVDLEQRGCRSSPHRTLSAVGYDHVVRVFYVHLLKGLCSDGCCCS